MGIAAHWVQNQKVPPQAGFTLIQANVGTETSHCCSMKDLSSQIWAQHPEKGEIKAFSQTSVLVFLSQCTAGIHQGSSTSPACLSHICSLSTPRGECHWDFFNLLPAPVLSAGYLFEFIAFLVHFVISFTQSPRLLKWGTEKENIGQIIIICMFSGTSQERVSGERVGFASVCFLRGKINWKNVERRLEELTLPRDRAEILLQGDGDRA